MILRRTTTEPCTSPTSTITNFRQFGEGDAALTITFGDGITALVGRNDSGKSAIIDAIRYVLLTRDQEFVRVQPDDFHIADDGQQATTIGIRCRLCELNDDEKGALAEYLSYDGAQVSLLINWTTDHSSSKVRLKLEPSGD